MKKIATFMLTLTMLFAIAVPVFADGDDSGVTPPLGGNYALIIGSTCPLSPDENGFYPADMEELQSQSFDVEITYNKPENGVDKITTETISGLQTNRLSNIFETKVSPYWIIGIKVSSNVDIEFTDFYFNSYVQDALPHLACDLVNDEVVNSNQDIAMPLSLKADSPVELLKDHPKNYMITTKYEPYICSVIEVKANVKTPLSVENPTIPLAVEIDGNSYNVKYSEQHNNESLAQKLSTAGEKTFVFEIQNEQYVDLTKTSKLTFFKNESNSGLDMEISSVSVIAHLDTTECTKNTEKIYTLGEVGVDSQQLPIKYNGEEIKLDKFNLITAFDERYINYTNNTEYVGSVFGSGNVSILVGIVALLIGICIGFVIKSVSSKGDNNIPSDKTKTQ